MSDEKQSEAAHPGEAAAIQWLAETASQGREELERLVKISSFTPDKEGVDAVGEALEGRLEGLGFRVSSVVTGVTGRTLVARRPAEGSHRLLLLGHLDTVHPADDGFEGLTTRGEDTDRLHGPGAADMKGGLLVMMRALEAMHRHDLLEGRHVTVVLCADEEQGSPSSGDIVRAEAFESQLCLGFEPGRPLEDGTTSFVTARKGMGRLTIEGRGRAAHTGISPHRGASALRELAAMVEELEALDDPEEGWQVRVGTFRSGTAFNVVPDLASLEVDFRFDDEDSGQILQEEITRVAGRHRLLDPDGRPLVGKTVKDALRRPPMVRSEAMGRMADRIVRWGSELGLLLREESRGGSSDAALAASMDCPAICGMGAVGDGFHTRQEWVSARSLVDRAQLATVVMNRFFQL